MMESKPIFWGKNQNYGSCRAHALPFCAGNFKRGILAFFLGWHTLPILHPKPSIFHIHIITNTIKLPHHTPHGRQPYQPRPHVTCHIPCQLPFPNGRVLSVRQQQTATTTLKLSNQIKHVSLGETAPLHFAWRRGMAPFAIIANQESIPSWESYHIKSMSTAKICMYVGQSWV